MIAAAPPRFSTVGNYLDHWSATHPDRDAVVDGDTRLSYGDLAAQVDALSTALLAAGIDHGDRVCVRSCPRSEVLVAYLAIVNIGAVFVGINPRSALAEMRDALAASSPSLLIAEVDSTSAADLGELDAENDGTLPIVVIGDDEDHSSRSIDDLMAGADSSAVALEAARSLVKPDDVAVMVFTSGSTGRPKGAMLTHASIVAGIWPQAERLSGDEVQRVMFHLPIHHFGSIGNTLTSTLFTGGTAVALRRFSPRAGLELIERERINVWGQVPTMFQMQLALDDFASFDLSSVTKLVFSGSAIPASTVRALEPLGADLITGYGMTETSGPVTLSARGASLDDLIETIGEAAAGSEITLRDSDGVEVAQGEEGEIWVRGDCVFGGYFQDAEASAGAVRDGWLATGDVGRMDEAGLYRLTGRLAERFKSGGLNIYPREVEAALEEHPAIDAACVVPVPDPLFGEVGWAFVLSGDPSAQPDEFSAFCRERLSNYKVPKRFVIADELPQLAVGKVDRGALKARAEQGQAKESSNTASR